MLAPFAMASEKSRRNTKINDRLFMASVRHCHDNNRYPLNPPVITSSDMLVSEDEFNFDMRSAKNHNQTVEFCRKIHPQCGEAQSPGVPCTSSGWHVVYRQGLCGRIKD
jgi:hypothetical protein